MSTLVNYVNENKEMSFNEVAFNEIDGLILAYAASLLDYTELKSDRILSFSEFEDEKYMREFTELTEERTAPYQLLKSMSRSKRYKTVEIANSETIIQPEIKEKFKAITFDLPDSKRVIAFRGSDASFLSWEENFSMLAHEPIPAVSSAVDYLQENIKNDEKDYYVVGHSKGGYTAVAASLMAPKNISSQISTVYNYDGPGFSQILELGKLLDNAEFDYHKFMPQDSFIGGLFEKTENYQIIESQAIGIRQHDPHTWKIEGNHFVIFPIRSMKSVWLSNVSLELTNLSEDKAAVETINHYFTILENSDLTSFGDFRYLKPRKIRSIYKQRGEGDHQDTIYSPFGLLGKVTPLLRTETKSAISSIKIRKIQQIISYRMIVTKELRKFRIN